MSQRPNLRQRLNEPNILNAPGVFDALSALLAEQAGFEAVFLSGSSVAYSQLARPDIGLVTMSEMADSCARITDRVDIPVLVDIDSGFGNAAHAGRTIRVMEQAGAAAVQIEDQMPINPANDLKGRPLFDIPVMVDKIKALTDDRRSRDCLISARSDSPASEPLGKTIERVAQYCDAGADIIFAEGLTDPDHVTEVVNAAGDIPVVYNLLHAGREIGSSDQLQKLGVSIALYPGNAILSAAHAMQAAFADLAHSLALPSEGFTLSPKGFNQVLGTPELVSRYKDFA